MLKHIKIYYITLINDSYKKQKEKSWNYSWGNEKFCFCLHRKIRPSKQQLRTYLLKKYLKFGAANVSKKNITNLIDVVLEDLEKTKFINDKFYSNSKAKSLIQREVQ